MFRKIATGCALVAISLVLIDAAWTQTPATEESGATTPPAQTQQGADQQQGWGWGWGRGRGWGGWWGGGHMGGGPGMGRGMFGIIDDNDDGRISDGEAAAHADLVFEAMDADDDESLTKEEFMAVRMGPGRGLGPRHAERQRQKEARFTAMDDDEDGSVTHSEFLQAARANFTAADSDNDGVVTPWEMRARRWW